MHEPHTHTHACTCCTHRTARTHAHALTWTSTAAPRSGVCELVNALKPGTINRVNKSKMPFPQARYSRGYS